MKIILFGTGCELCREIAGNIEEAIKTVDFQVEFEKTSDISKMLSYGIKSTPSVVINNQIVSISKPLSSDEMIILINEMNSSGYPA